MAKIRYGLSNCYYAKYNGLVNDAESYATPVQMPGAVAITLDPSGESVDEYADNILWFHSDVNNGYSGSLEVEVLGDDFRKDILGEEEDSAGVLFENSDAPVVEFALLGQFQLEGDNDTGKRFCLFRCTASRPSMNGSTKEATISPQHDTVNLTAMPRVSDHMTKATAKNSSDKYATWFNNVVTKAQ